MLIGLRLLLLLALFLVAVPLLGWLLTRNARLYRFAVTSARILGVLLAVLACVWLGERLIIAL